MKNKFYQNLESIGTASWLLMDFIWMCGISWLALLIFIPSFLCLVGACIKYEGKKMSELHVLNASVCWLLMNATWIMGEITSKNDYLICGKIAFFIACIFVYLAFRASKKEKEPIDFKRLKIK